MGQYQPQVSLFAGGMEMLPELLGARENCWLKFSRSGITLSKRYIRWDTS